MVTVQSIGPDTPLNDKSHVLSTLRRLLEETMHMRRDGVPYARLAHAQGYADGYIRMMIDAGMMTERELLTFVSEVRRGVDGPASAPIRADEDVAVVAA